MLFSGIVIHILSTCVEVRGCRERGGGGRGTQALNNIVKCIMLQAQNMTIRLPSLPLSYQCKERNAGLPST